MNGRSFYSFICLVVIAIVLSVNESNAAPLSTTMDTTFSNNATLVADQFLLYWNYNLTDVVFKIVVKNFKWAGFGVSASGGMKYSDVIVTFAYANGSMHFSDRSVYGSNSLPTVDKYQDWRMLGSKTEGAYTSIMFRRKIKLCSSTVRPNSTDIDHDFVDGTQVFIYAYGTSLNANGDDVSYHGASSRGIKVMPLLNTVNQVVNLDMSKVEIADFRVNVTLNSKSKTTYHCEMFKIPTDWLKTKRHMIRVQKNLHVLKN